MGISNKTVLNATKWSSIAEIAAKLISPIVNMILARLLLPSAFGAVATINLVITFAELFTDAGFQKYIIQHEFATEEELDQSSDVAFWTNLAFSVFLYSIIVIFRHPLASLAGNAALGNGMAVAGFAMVLVSLSSIQTARYRRSFDFKTLFYVRVITAAIPLVVTVPLAIVFKNYWALVIGTLASKLAEAVILVAKSPWKPSFSYSFRCLKEMLSFSVWTIVESVIVWLINYIGIFIVGNLLSEHYLGVYQTAITTVNAYMNIITGAITPVVLSALSRLQNEEKAYNQTLMQFQKWVALLVIPMSLGLYVCRDLVTQILLGSQWAEAAQLIGLWSLSSGFVIVFSNFSSMIYISKGKPKISVISHGLHLLFLIPTVYFAAREGFEMLSATRALIRLQGVVVNLVLLRAVFHLDIWQMIKNILPCTFVSVLMALVVSALQRVSGHIVWSFACVGFGILFYAVACVFTPSIRRDLMGSTEKIKPIHSILLKIERVCTSGKK